MVHHPHSSILLFNVSCKSEMHFGRESDSCKEVEEPESEIRNTKSENKSQLEFPKIGSSTCFPFMSWYVWYFEFVSYFVFPRPMGNRVEHDGRSWEIIVEPAPEEQILVILTVYPVD